MKTLLAACWLATAPVLLHAGAPAELTALEAKYDQTKFAYDEASRQKYVMDLCRLRFKFVMAGGNEWQEVDAEIIRHPAPRKSDSEALSKLRLGDWHSSRHDYRFEIDGTWRMREGGQDDPDATHGNWSIKGAQYSEMFAADDGASATTYTIILADAENFIFTDGTHLFFEKRTLGKGLPIRRDERGE
jgi:hypothetical protein